MNNDKPTKSKYRDRSQKTTRERARIRRQETNFKDSIDEGWREFWLKRGRTKPPEVSSRVIGCFDLK